MQQPVGVGSTQIPNETFLDALGNRTQRGDLVINCLSREAGIFVKIAEKTLYSKKCKVYHWISLSSYVVRAITTPDKRLSIISTSNLAGNYNFIRVWPNQLRPEDLNLYNMILPELNKNPEFWDVRLSSRWRDIRKKNEATVS